MIRTQKPTPLATTGNWKVDPAHSQIGFGVRHMVVSTTRGRFTAFDGTLVADPKNLAKSGVTFTIQTASVDTGNQQRDDHLRSADFFDAVKFPEMTFRSTRIARRGDGYLATGVLTLHGVKRTITFPFSVTGPVKGMQGETRAGVQARFPIRRKDYGLTWNRILEGGGLTVGDEVAVDLDVEFVKTP